MNPGMSGLFVLLVPTLAVAQETTGMIKGIVTSQDGATLPGVTVIINDASVGLQRTAEEQFVRFHLGRGVDV